MPDRHHATNVHMDDQTSHTPPDLIRDHTGISRPEVLQQPCWNLCSKWSVTSVIDNVCLTSGEEELQRNPRSRSAKLRIVEKL